MKSKILIWAALITLGLVSIIASLNAYTLYLSFLSIFSLATTLILFKKTKGFLRYISMLINCVALLRLLYIIFLVNFASFKAENTVYEYYIPKNYDGWILIKQGLKEKSAINKISDMGSTRYKIFIPSSGKLETSSILNERHITKYFLFDEKDTILVEDTKINNKNSNSLKRIIKCEGGGKNLNYFYITSDTNFNDEICNDTPNL
jgi:hypothetical protein